MPAPLASLVLAQQEPAAGAGNFLFLIAIFAIFYLLLIRPQQRRARQQRELISSVEVNDRVVTLGGIHGTVRYVDDEIVHLEVAPGTQITIAKAAIARRLVDADTGTGTVE